MRQSQILTLATIFGAAAAAPKIPIHTSSSASSAAAKRAPQSAQKTGRQSNACFIIGDTELPQEVADVADSLSSSIQCDTSFPTIDGVPDVLSGDVTFDSIDFSQAGQTPLEFALNTFSTADSNGGNLADTDLDLFQNGLNVYLATEAGIRSIGADPSQIKIPKFFLEMQVSRIQTAQGNPPTDAGLQVDHLRDKVLTNGASEDQSLLDEVTKLASVVS